MKVVTKGNLFNNPERRVSKAIDAALNTAATAGLKNYVSATPVDSGFMKGSWSQSAVRSSGSSGSVDLENKAYYSGFVYRKSIRLQRASTSIGKPLGAELSKQIKKQLG